MKESYYEIDKQYEDLSKAKLYWEIGKGLQEVDYLHTSKKLDDLINEHLAGKKDYLEVEKEIKEYHQSMGILQRGKMKPILLQQELRNF